MPRHATPGSFGQPNAPKPGRKKGTPNKVTGEVKEMILRALAEAGGVEYLKARAVDSPTAFMALVGRVLPLQVSGDPDQPLIPQAITFVVTQQPDSDNRT